VVGPYEGYARNAEAHKRVMRKHAAATDSVRTSTSLDADVLKLAEKEWAECLRVGEVNGWRNAQASVLAPTGTIGFMMDCDTTGVEPDFSLVRTATLSTHPVSSPSTTPSSIRQWASAPSPRWVTCA
jgi:ribonucleoside-diphosphate reductase alpha chain